MSPTNNWMQRLHAASFAHFARCGSPLTESPWCANRPASEMLGAVGTHPSGSRHVQATPKGRAANLWHKAAWSMVTRYDRCNLTPHCWSLLLGLLTWGVCQIVNPLMAGNQTDHQCAGPPNTQVCMCRTRGPKGGFSLCFHFKQFLNSVPPKQRQPYDRPNMCGFLRVCL